MDVAWRPWFVRWCYLIFLYKSLTTVSSYYIVTIDAIYFYKLHYSHNTIDKNWDVLVPMEEMKMVPTFQNAMTYDIRLNLIGGLQNKSFFSQNGLTKSWYLSQ